MADFVAVYNVRGQLAFLTDRRADTPIEYRRVADHGVDIRVPGDARVFDLESQEIPIGPIKDLLLGDKLEVVSERYGVEIVVRRH